MQAHFRAALASDPRAAELLAARGIIMDTVAGVAAGSDRLPGSVADLTAIAAVAPNGDGWRKTFRGRLTVP